MKLFTRKEIKDDEQKSFDLLREQEQVLVKSLEQKTKELNDTIPELERQIQEKKRQVADLVLSHATVFKEQEASVHVLEERRAEALRPIELERRELEDRRLEVTRCLLQLGEKQLEIASLLEISRRKEQEIYFEKQSLEVTRQEASAFFEQQKKEATDLLASSQKAVDALKQEHERLDAQRQDVQEKMLSLHRAQVHVKTAMIEVDKRLELEKVEQQKTQHERMKLAKAIEIARKRYGIGAS